MQESAWERNQRINANALNKMQRRGNYESLHRGMPGYDPNSLSEVMYRQPYHPPGQEPPGFMESLKSSIMDIASQLAAQGRRGAELAQNPMLNDQDLANMANLRSIERTLGPTTNLSDPTGSNYKFSNADRDLQYLINQRAAELNDRRSRGL